MKRVAVAVAVSAGLIGASVLAMQFGRLIAFPNATPTVSVESSASTASLSSPKAIAEVLPVFSDRQDGYPIDLEPGTYRFGTFRPNVEFTVDRSGWEVTHEYVDGWDLNRAFLVPGLPGVEGHMRGDLGVGYVAAGRVQVTFETPCSNGATALLSSAPSAVIEWLQGHEYLETTDPLPTTLGGYAGLTLDVTQRKAPEEGLCERPQDVADNAWDSLRKQVHIFPFAGRDFLVGPPEKFRVIVADIEGIPVTILVGVEDGEYFDEFMAEEAQPLLDSVRFPGGDG